MDLMIFIDWISTPDHASFNHSFFSALRLTNARCYVFSKKLIVSTVDCHVLKSHKGRLGRALGVYKLCWKHRNDRIVFLSYDPVLLPFLFFIKNIFMVFEHNTTPEGGKWSKHAIWQRLFLRRILRMAQFPGQVEILRKLKQQVIFVGSPISPVSLSGKKSFAPGCGFFIAPSYRASLMEIDKIAPFIQGATIIVKRAVFESSEAIDRSGVRIEPVEYIDLDKDDEKIHGVVITVNSRIRGTGWFNDAITRRLPIITTNNDARILFRETFPHYPFVDLSATTDKTTFGSQMAAAKAFDPTKYVEGHNELFRERFRACCKNLDWPEPC